jgi:hypothetical protein
VIQIKAELFEELNGTIDGLRRALQNAIALEHSTIPPYLYALYSVKPGQNSEAVWLIRSVVLEEMLHMALVCNILNAVDGSPAIDDPAFIPRYPGPLPGAVESGLVVPLAPLSKQLIHDIFMVIEEPEDPLNFPVVGFALDSAQKPVTIGQFYAKIKQQIQELSSGKNIFTGDPRRQLTTGFAPLQTIRVTDANSAIAAIDLIVQQGEGTHTSPLDPDREFAHYYRYAEIFYGKKLISNPNPTVGAPEYVYGGHSISFDPCGIWPVISNPNSSTYKTGTKARNLNYTFNCTYTSFLKSMQLVFNGEPDRLGPAIGLMESIKAQAVVMMSYELVPGQTAGPTFEYSPASD